VAALGIAHASNALKRVKVSFCGFRGKHKPAISIAGFIFLGTNGRIGMKCLENRMGNHRHSSEKKKGSLNQDPLLCMN
jgi:hypothetical protein